MFCVAGVIVMIGDTVTTQVAVCALPLAGVLVAVMVAVPAPTALTRPETGSTVATLVLLEAQATVPVVLPAASSSLA